MPALYSVRKVGKNVIVESQNANAKQVFFGWGSDQNAIDGSFYGRQVRGLWGPNWEHRWKWVLTPDAVEVMLKNLHLELTDPAYKDGSLAPAARELQRKLRAFGERRTACIRPHGLCEHADHCVEHAQDERVLPCRAASKKGRR